MSVSSLNEKCYIFVIVDDYSRFTWVLFLTHKIDAFGSFHHYRKRVKKECGYPIVKIQSDHRGEFENEAFHSFCLEHGIDHTFSTPRTPQLNCVVERKK